MAQWAMCWHAQSGHVWYKLQTTGCCKSNDTWASSITCAATCLPTASYCWKAAFPFIWMACHTRNVSNQNSDRLVRSFPYRMSSHRKTVAKALSRTKTQLSRARATHRLVKTCQIVQGLKICAVDVSAVSGDCKSQRMISEGQSILKSCTTAFCPQMIHWALYRKYFTNNGCAYSSFSTRLLNITLPPLCGVLSSKSCIQSVRFSNCRSGQSCSFVRLLSRDEQVCRWGVFQIYYE